MTVPAGSTQDDGSLMGVFQTVCSLPLFVYSTTTFAGRRPRFEGENRDSTCTEKRWKEIRKYSKIVAVFNVGLAPLSPGMKTK